MGKNDPKEFVVRGKPLNCPVCGCNSFWQDDARVVKGAVFELNPTEITTLTCDECKHIMWFES